MPFPWILYALFFFIVLFDFIFQKLICNNVMRNTLMTFNNLDKKKIEITGCLVVKALTISISDKRTRQE